MAAKLGIGYAETQRQPRWLLSETPQSASPDMEFCAAAQHSGNTPQAPFP